MKRTSAFTRPAVLDEVDQLVVVDAADDDGVDLEARRSARAAAAMPVEHARRARRTRVSALKRRGRSVSRLTVMRPQAGGAAAPRPGRRAGRRWSSAPGRAGPACAASMRDERRQVAAQQRLAAGQPHLVDAERDEDVDERADLLEVQHVLARQPDVVRPPACSTRSAGCSGR